MSDITLTLIGKPGCHLCDDARVVVTDVMRQLMGGDVSDPAPSTDVSDPAPSTDASDPAPSTKVSDPEPDSAPSTKVSDPEPDSAPSTKVYDPAPDSAPSTKVSPHALAENSPGSRLELEELSIDEDPELLKKYGEQIPVLLINGKVHNFWRIDPVRLTKSLKELL